MADPEVVAAMQYMQEQRNQQVIEDILNTPPPPPVAAAAEAFAARLWPADDRPPVSDAEREAAIKFLLSATGQEPELPRQVLPFEADLEGGPGPDGPMVPNPPSGQGLGGGTPLGPGGWPDPGHGPADTAHEIFMKWLLNPLSNPFNTPQVNLSAKDKLAAVTAAMREVHTQEQLKRLQGLQATYYYQARNEQRPI